MQYAIEVGSNCNFQVSQLCSVETYQYLSEVENLYDIYMQNFLRNLKVKEFCKLVYMCRNYDQKSSALFFF